MPGNGTGVINTCRGVFDSQGQFTGQWLDQVAIRDLYDGTSNTILAGEMHIPSTDLNFAPLNGPIFRGPSLESHTRVGGVGVPLLTGQDDAGAIFGFGSAHPGITNFVFADGSTQSMENFVDTILLGRMCHRSAGELTN